MSGQHTLCDILDDLAKASSGSQTSVGDIVAAFEHRSFGPLLLVPAMLVLIPVVGAIPGASIVGAALIFLIALQLVIGKTTPWIPRKLQRIEFDGQVLEKGVEKAQPLARWIDRYTSDRLGVLTTPVIKRLCALLCLGLALMLVPLAAVPMGVTVPACAIFCFALAFTANDGLLILIALFITAASFLGLIYWL